MARLRRRNGRAGGINRPLILGQAGHIAAQRSGARTTEAFLPGALLIMGVYHLTIGLQRRRESASFWFGVFCLMIVPRLVVTGTRNFPSTFSDAPFLLYYKPEYLSFYAAVPIFAVFTARLLPRQVRPEVLRFIFGFYGGLPKNSAPRIGPGTGRVFLQFDAVIRRNNLEKLKTIGDVYMCAGGLPKPNATHAIDACLATLELRAFMAQMAEVKTAPGRLLANSDRHTLGAGVADRINVLQETYDLVKDLFEFEYRGQVAVRAADGVLAGARSAK